MSGCQSLRLNKKERVAMGFRFKLANFIMGDYLRNYLVVGVRLPLLKVLDSKVDPYTAHLIKKALKTTEEIFKI